MADAEHTTDQQDVTERRNDAKKPFEISSSSLPRKRPSPNSNDGRKTKSIPATTQCDDSGKAVDGSTSGIKRRSNIVARAWSRGNGTADKHEHNDSNDSGSILFSPFVLRSTDEEEMDDDDTDSSSTTEFKLCDDSGGGGGAGGDSGSGRGSNGYPIMPKLRKKSSSSTRGFKVRTISSIEARTNIPMVSVNSALLSDEFVRNFSTHWSLAERDNNGLQSSPKNSADCKSLSDDTVMLHTDPFTICVTQNFLENESFINELVREMCQMEWQRKQIDLYEFHQTTDLVNVAKPALHAFYDTLTNVMLPWMETVTGLSLTHVSASCSMYNYGDFLLVHDDLLTDRQIAFVYYVSPWASAAQWTDEMGGALELFECDEKTGQPMYPTVKKIPPRNNQFTFFPVCHKSFHQVGEVTNLVYPRLTINGWFHGRASTANQSNPKDSGCSTSNSTTNTTDESINSTLPLQLNNYLTYCSPVVDDLDLTEWINTTYLNASTKKHIQAHIEDKSEASLEQFLIGDIYDVLVSEFRTNRDLEWVLEGPANQRKYETLRLTSQSTGPPKDLHSLFSSKSMFTLLAQYTDLDFDGPNAQTPKCSVQICRFTQGCYTLLGDSSTFAENALDIVLYFNAQDQVGTITYLSPECMAGAMRVSRDADATTSSEWSNSAATNAIATTTKASGSATEMLVKSKANAIDINSARRNCSKNKSNASPTSISLITSGDETGADISSISYDPNEDVEVIAIMNQPDRNDTATSSAAGTSMSDAIDDEDFDTDYTTRSINKVSCGSDSDDDDDDDEEDMDDLAQENVLLTVHPKNNALNLVYRTEGQAKFVKYVSKNCIKADDYVYILFATFKE